MSLLMKVDSTFCQLISIYSIQIRLNSGDTSISGAHCYNISFKDGLADPSAMAQALLKHVERSLHCMNDLYSDSTSSTL